MTQKQVLQLPAGWKFMIFGDCAEITNGRAYAQEELLDRGTPVLRIQNLNGGDRWYYSDLALPEDKHCERGDLLFAWSATFGPYRWDGPRCIYHYHIWKVTPKKVLDKAFAYYLLAHLTETLKQSARGISMLHLTKAGVEGWRVPIPPLSEQQRIAAILDQADGLRRKRRRALKRLNDLTRAIFIEMFGLHRTSIPRVKLGDLIKVRSGDALILKDHDPEGKFLVYGGNGVNGYHSKYLVEKGTIIIGRVGVYCGAVHVAKSRAWVTDNALIVDVKAPGLITEYLAASLTYANLNQYAGQSAQPLVSGSRIYPVEIVLPSVTLQTRFAARVAEIDKCRDLHNAHLGKLEALFASLQDRAFSGELTSASAAPKDAG
jgi:type I restriction enzyme S subunit